LYSRQHPISPELLTLVRAGVPADQVRVVLTSLDGSPAWDSILAEAARQGVTPLLYRVFKPYRQQVPPAAWQRLTQAYRVRAARNALRLDEWQAVVQHLADRDIELLVLKGAALAETLYGDIALRPMGDLDVLVRRKQLAAARTALAGRGYAPVQVEHFAGAAEQFESQVSLARRDAATGLTYVCELHWHLIDSPFYARTLPLDWFWQTAVPLRLGGVETRALGAEARLLHLCAHLALHHHGTWLLWTCDVDRALRQAAGRLDWDVVTAKAVEYRLVLPVRSVLAQTVEWLGTPVPADVMARLAALRPGRQEAQVFAFMAGPPQGVIARFLNDLAHLPGGRAKVRFVLANVFPAPAYMRQRYRIRRGWLLPLYYLYRLGRGVWDGVRTLLSHELQKFS
jgi:hypothetical protein